jgi:hypothetical protein
MNVKVLARELTDDPWFHALLSCGTARAQSGGIKTAIAGLVHLERTRWDPKDGELYLARAKPGETLVEARLDSDVQIDPHSWV